MFRRMTIAYHHPPFVIAGLQPRSLFHPDMTDGQVRNGPAKATPALGGKIVDQMLFPAAEKPFIQRLLRNAVALVGDHQTGQQPFGAIHVQGHFEPFSQPAGTTDMVGVIMGDDDLGRALPVQRAFFEQMFPGLDDLGHEQSGIGNSKSGAAVCMAVSQYPIVDVAQRTGHRRAGPADTGHQFEIFAKFRFIIAERIGQTVRFNRIEAMIGEHRIISGEF